MSVMQQILLAYGASGAAEFWTPNLVLMLDPGDAASYPGSGQNVLNSWPAPADGSAQSAYDYFFGSSSGVDGRDPGWTSRGDRSYFDGWGCLTLAGSPTAFLSAMHKTGAKWTVEIWQQWGGTIGGGGIGPLFDSGTSDQGGSDMSRGSMFWDQQLTFGSTALNMRVKRDSSGTTDFSKAADTAVPGKFVTMVAVSFDGTGGTNSFFYRDGNYDQSGGVDTWSGTLSSPGSADVANPSRVAARGDSNQSAPSATRIFLLRVYNTNLTKAQLDVNWNGAKDRFATGSLLHFNGTNGSTSFPDVKGVPWTRNVATITTAHSKFGGASGDFTSAGARLTVLDEPWFDFADKPFTIEFWAKKGSGETGDGHMIDLWSNRLLLRYRNGSPQLFVAGIGAPLLSWTATISSTDFVHVALVRNGNDWTVYFDGVVQATATASGTISSASEHFVIGNSFTGSDTFGGYIDEFRVTHGVARYTGAFTPPAAPFPD